MQRSTEPAGPRPLLELHLDEHVELRKPHPCGSRTWRVVRLGADIGLVCDGCGHRVLMERAQLERRLRSRDAKAARS